MFRQLTISLALAACAVTAFALPKPSEVKAAFAAGNYSQAESMLQEVMKEKPTAAVHYQLGQVFSAEGKHAQALNEMRQAQVLDPSLKFASTGAAFMKSLATEQAIVSPPVATVAQAVPMINYSTARETAQPLPTQHESSGLGLGLILLVLVLIGGGTLAFFVLGSKKAKKEEADAQTADGKAKTSKLLEMSKVLEDAILICKTSAISDADKTLVLGRITALQASVRTKLAEIKDGKGCTNAAIVSLQTYVEQAADEAANGIKVGAVAAPALVETSTGYSTRAEANVHNDQPGSTTAYAPPVSRPSYAPSPTQSIFHHYPTPSPAPAPIILNNSGNDLLTGMLIGEALSDHRDRTVYVERERAPAPAPYYAPAPAPVFDAPAEREDRYSAPAPALDTSNNDSYDDTPSIDTSSSSSDSDSY